MQLATKSFDFQFTKDDFPVYKRFIKSLHFNYAPSIREGKIFRISCLKRSWAQINDCLGCEFFGGFVPSWKKEKMRYNVGRDYIFCRGQIRRVYEKKVNIFVCNVCNEQHFDFYVGLRHFDDTHRYPLYSGFFRNVDYEFELLDKLRSSKNGRSVLRKKAAVFRLYRTYGFTPKEIAYITSRRLVEVRRDIGIFFKYACLRDDSCVFKSFFIKREA